MRTDPIEIYFNPRCSKARGARQMLEERGVEFRVIEYLQEPPARADLDALLAKLGTDDPTAIMRKKEAPWSELGLDDADRDRLLGAITSHPILLERPIVVRGERAVVARPPELLDELFDD